MPMPHRTFAQVAKRRLVGKEGKERIREVRALLAELPDYKNGPYADLRKSLLAEIEDTRVRSNAVHRDSIAVRREGAAQIALVGPPNVGKSSLLQALSEIQIKTGDYPFTTLRPVPALTRIGGVLVQLVEIPGLIEGASDDRGGGRALLGVLRSADAIVYCARADGDPARARGRPRRDRGGRHREAGRPRRDAGRRSRCRRARPARRTPFPDLAVVPVSVLDEASLDAFRAAVWALTGLIRVRLRKDGSIDPRAPRARPRRDRRRRGGLGPPRPRRDVQRRSRLGPVRAVRRPARRARPRGPGRRRRGDPVLTTVLGRTAFSGRSQRIRRKSPVGFAHEPDTPKEPPMTLALPPDHHDHPDHEIEEHDRGLVYDLTTLDRRRMLKLLGFGGLSAGHVRHRRLRADRRVRVRIGIGRRVQPHRARSARAAPSSPRRPPARSRATAPTAPTSSPRAASSGATSGRASDRRPPSPRGSR